MNHPKVSYSITLLHSVGTHSLRLEQTGLNEAEYSTARVSRHRL
jgi:hypothetical protein